MLSCKFRGTSTFNFSTGPLSSPQGFHVVESTPEAIKVAWATPENNGGNPILGYLVEKKRSERKVWQTVTDTTDEECTVENLIEDAKYDFRVTARTAVGPGAPAELVDVVARFSYGKV